MTRLPEPRTPEHVRDVHDESSREWSQCPCGNTPSSEGHYPCDREGNYVSPEPSVWYEQLWRCARCGRIWREEDGLVVGHYDGDDYEVPAL